MAEGYDAGIRMGEQVAKDMIAVRIGPDMRMAVVASPAYFEGRTRPVVPQDLMGHNCINIRMPTYGGLFPWELEKDGREVNVRVEGQLVFNSLGLRLSSALDGLGVAYMPEDQILPHVKSGRLIRVLEDWCPPFPGDDEQEQDHADQLMGEVILPPVGKAHQQQRGGQPIEEQAKTERVVRTPGPRRRGLGRHQSGALPSQACSGPKV